jgi:hypothetical protein
MRKSRRKRRWSLPSSNRIIGRVKGMNPVVNLTAKAVQEINEILSRGKGVEIAVRNGKVVVWETASKKKYEAVIER